MKNFLCLFILLNTIVFTKFKAQKFYNKKVDLSYYVTDQQKKTQITYSKEKKFWSYKGINSLSFNQSVLNNWMINEPTSMNITSKIDYNFFFKKNLRFWDSNILLSYGQQSKKKLTTKKTEDIIDLNSIYGYYYSNDWYYVVRLNFRTQFYKGYNYDKKPKEKISNFLSPAYFSIGFGFDYRPNSFFVINIHPLTSRITYIKDKKIFDSYDTDNNFLGKKNSYGVKPGKHFQYKLGTFFGINYKWNISNNLSLDNSANIFSNYLKNSKSLHISYSESLIFKISKVISLNLNVELINNENQIKKIQFKENLNLGITYDIKNK